WVRRTIVLADAAEFRGPDLLAVLLLQGDGKLRAAAGAFQVDPALRHRRRGVALAKLLGRPREFRPLLGPLLEQARLARLAVAVGTAPLRPVVGPGRDSEYTQTEADAENASGSHDILIAALVTRTLPAPRRRPRPTVAA